MDLSALDTRIEVTAFDFEKAGFFFFFEFRAELTGTFDQLAAYLDKIA